MLAFGFALPILFENPKLGLPLIILAFSLGFSIMYIGYHYPTDVIAGALFSIAMTLFRDEMKPIIARMLARYGLG